MKSSNNIVEPEGFGWSEKRRSAGAGARRKGRPYYQQIKTDLEKAIGNGELRPGQLAPSESELIARYRVSSTTARRALDELQSEGLLERYRGRGTFVSKMATVLKRQRVGVVIRDLFSLTHPFLAQVLGAVEKTFHESGAHLVILRATASVTNSGNGQTDLLPLLEHEQIRHAMLLSNMPVEAVRPLVDSGIHCLGVNTRYLDDRIPHVAMDFASNFRLGLKEVLKLGHRRVAFLTSEPPMKERGVLNSASLLSMVYKELRSEFPEIDPEPTVECAADLDAVPESVTSLLERSPRPTAILCYDELVGLEVMRVVEEAGLEIPDDISVVGSRLLPTSPLACIDPPLLEMAKEASTAMLGWIATGQAPRSRLLAAQRFLPRRTLASPPFEI